MLQQVAAEMSEFELCASVRPVFRFNSVFLQEVTPACLATHLTCERAFPAFALHLATVEDWAVLASAIAVFTSRFPIDLIAATLAQGSPGVAGA